MKDGGTPLHLAVSRGDLGICQLLVQNGADLSDRADAILMMKKAYRRNDVNLLLAGLRAGALSHCSSAPISRLFWLLAPKLCERIGRITALKLLNTDISKEIGKVYIRCFWSNSANFRGFLFLNSNEESEEGESEEGEPQEADAEEQDSY